MKLSISSVDSAPEELHEQVPFNIDLIRQIPGEDRSDYWLGVLETPLSWNNGDVPTEITHVIVASRWAGTLIEPHVENIPVGIAYVTDNSQLHENLVDFEKCNYVAIAMASEIEGGNAPEPLSKVLSGRVGKFFGMGVNK